MGAFLQAIDGTTVVQGGAVVLLSLVVLAIVRGALVPRWTLDRIVRECDKQVAAAERREQQWRAVALTYSGQAQALLVTAQVAEATLTALPVEGGQL